MSDDTVFIKTFIMTHCVRLAIFNEFLTLNMLDIAENHFESMMKNKKLELLKYALQNMINSNQWNAYRQDDIRRAARSKRNFK